MAHPSFGAGGINNSTIAQHGLGQGGPKLGLFDQESTQTAELGFTKRFTDGRTYKYANFVAACTVGKLVSQDVSTTTQASLNSMGETSAGVAIDSYVAGDTKLYLYNTNYFDSNTVANRYAGGYLNITDDDGEGYQYTIKSSGAGTMTGPMMVELYDPVVGVMTSETSFGIIGNPYRGVCVASTTDPLVAGVTVRSMTADYHGWVQSWGWATVLTDLTAGEIAKGTQAQLSNGVSGAVQPMGGGFNSILYSMTALTTLWLGSTILSGLYVLPVVGFFGTAVTDTEYGPVYLQITP